MTQNKSVETSVESKHPSGGVVDCKFYQSQTFTIRLIPYSRVFPAFTVR